MTIPKSATPSYLRKYWPASQKETPFAGVSQKRHPGLPGGPQDPGRLRTEGRHCPGTPVIFLHPVTDSTAPAPSGAGAAIRIFHTLHVMHVEGGESPSRSIENAIHPVNFPHSAASSASSWPSPDRCGFRRCSMCPSSSTGGSSWSPFSSRQWWR